MTSVTALLQKTINVSLILKAGVIMQSFPSTIYSTIIISLSIKYYLIRERNSLNLSFVRPMMESSSNQDF